MIAPVNPGESVPINQAEMARFRPSYQVWSYMLSRRGYAVTDDELGDDRLDLLARFHAAADRWLKTGESA